MQIRKVVASGFNKTLSKFNRVSFLKWGFFSLKWENSSIFDGWKMNWGCEYGESLSMPWQIYINMKNKYMYDLIQFS